MSDLGQFYVLVSVDDTRCDYCLECTVVCLSGALTYDHCFEHDSEECWYCESCMDCCPNDAIKIRRQV